MKYSDPFSPSPVPPKGFSSLLKSQQRKETPHNTIINNTKKKKRSATASPRQQQWSIDKDSYCQETVSSPIGELGGISPTSNILSKPFSCSFCRATKRGILGQKNDSNKGKKKILESKTSINIDKSTTTTGTTNFSQSTSGVFTSQLVIKKEKKENNLLKNIHQNYNVIIPNSNTKTTITTSSVAPLASKEHKIELQFASPLSRTRDFSFNKDPHENVMKRLEEEHKRSYRRALYSIQQIHPDPWWRLQSSVYYDSHMPELVTCDDGLLFSRVARDVWDSGVQWLDLPNSSI